MYCFTFGCCLPCPALWVSFLFQGLTCSFSPCLELDWSVFYFGFLCSLRPMLYIRDLFVLVNIAAISLLVITIILRAAQSNIQWVFAALAYLMYTMLALEYLSLI